ncbi:MAG: hypothetical protein HC860_18740 [Alkalinema sp. RU_4_3]|nr:hypothetical protein [Alkalinema sp. RU_4_3]NJR70437.1 hypothetical protein [Synechococcales cyanobacterium CRU_2_2]
MTQSALTKYTAAEDFGQLPLALAHLTDDPSQVAIYYGVSGFLGFVMGGWPIAAYIAFLGLNDFLYARTKNNATKAEKASTQAAELRKILGEPEPVEAPAIATPMMTAAATPAREQNRLIDTLIDNPYQCRAIIAGQRTGKTYGAAVSTYALKQDGTKVYYINLQDHGQGNAAAFAHADKVAIGNLAALGKSEAAIDLVGDAIDIVKEFYAEDDAILVIDEWMSLGAETLEVDGLDSLWREIANKATALTSNGLGSGKAIWGLAPFFKATSLRKDARTLKLFAPLVLSIAPGQSVPWQNPKNAKTTQITMSAQVLQDVCTNWQNAIAFPADELARQWKRDGSDRVYWWNGLWHPIGQFPALPTPMKKAESSTAQIVQPDSALVESLNRAIGRVKADSEVLRSAEPSAPQMIDDEYEDVFGPVIEEMIALVFKGKNTLAKVRHCLKKSSLAIYCNDLEEIFLDDDRLIVTPTKTPSGQISVKLELK